MPSKLNKLKKRLLFKLLISFIIGFYILTLNVFAALPSISPEEGIYLVDKTTNTVIYKQNENVKFDPASITKLLTALILVENIDDLDQIVTVGNEVNDFTYEDSTARLWEGQQLTYNDLLYAMLVPSGNDAALTIAINVGKVIGNTQDRAEAEKAFYDAMNQKAQDLGMTSSHFTNPHGRSAPEHYTTAKDYTLLAEEALSNDIIKKAASTKKYTLKNQDGSDNNLLSSDYCLYVDSNEMSGYPVLSQIFPNLTTENQPNPFYSAYISAAKTGRADNGARSYAFYSDQNENQIFGVILNSMENTAIFSESRDLVETLNSNYKDIQVEELIDSEPISLNNTSILSPEELNLTSNETRLFDDSEGVNGLNITFRFDEDLIKFEDGGYTLIKPIKENQKVGSVLISNSNGVVQTIPVYSENNYLSKNVLDFILDNSIYFGIGLIILIGIIVFIIKRRKTKSQVKF